jgi:hypothetical protein
MRHTVHDCREPLAVFRNPISQGVGFSGIYPAKTMHSAASIDPLT